MTGYSLAELTVEGHPKSKLLHPDDLKMIAERDKDMEKYGTSRDFPPMTIRWYHKDGSIRWGEMATILLSTVDDPDAKDVLVFIHDITERMHVHEEFEKSRDRMADLATELDVAKQEAESNLDMIQRDISFAASVQEAILPPSFPTDKRYDVEGFMQAARTVGGDFYDFYVLDDDTIGFAIADVANKGVSAALFMAASSTLLKTAVKSGKSPAIALEDVNRRLNEQNPLSMFVSVFCAVLHLPTGRLIYSNAGHNPPFLIKAGESPEELPLTGDTFLGILDDLSYKERTVNLEAGDTLFLYTDGITEAENEDHRMFGEERLHQSLQTSQGRPIPEVLGRVRENVAAFVGGAEQSDDLTVLSIRYKGP